MSEKATRIEDLDYTLVDKEGRVKKIQWGDDYYEWPMEQRLEFAESVAAAMNTAADVMQKERNARLEDIELLTKKLEYADQQVSQQKEILVNHITQTNEKNIQQQETIASLRNKVVEQDAIIKAQQQKIEELENGDNRRLVKQNHQRS